MSKVKRSQFATYLNIAASGSPEEWSLMGVGITSGEVAYNPNIETVTYIHEDSGGAVVVGYAPAMPIEAMAVAGDPIFAFVDNLRKTRALLGYAHTEAVNVWLYETPISGIYPAEYQPVTISLDTFGGEGGSSSKINFGVNYRGDQLLGWFKPVDASFTFAPVNAVLDTMVIGTVTLTPLFATDKTFLWYAGTVANEVVAVSMTSTCVHPDAVVVQKVGAAVVAQGADAALDVGDNTLTIQITVGTEVVTYTIIITREAA